MKYSIFSQLTQKVYLMRSDCGSSIIDSLPTTHAQVRLNAWNGLDTIDEGLKNLKQSIRRELYIKSRKDNQ